jgi:uncharacterized protein with GYD domain
MARYITLIRFTEQGAKGMSKSASRARAFRKAAEEADVTVEAQYWTVGSYDGCLILTSEDETEPLRLLAALAGEGNVRTETMLALDADEFTSVTGKPK